MWLARDLGEKPGKRPSGDDERRSGCEADTVTLDLFDAIKNESPRRMDCHRSLRREIR
jgi:hypothetical protein